MDVFFAPNSVAPAFFRGKCVVTIHDIGPALAAEFASRRLALYSRFYSTKIIKRSAQRANKIIAVSKNTKNDLANWLGLHDNKIEVVYHGRDERFTQIRDQRQIKAILDHHRLPDRYILHVGGFSGRKNLGPLVTAYYKLRREYKISEKLVLVGKPGYGYSKIEQLRGKLALQKHLFIATNISDNELPVIYSGATLFVLPSLLEGFSLPVLEAMSCGVPVVASNRTAMPEVVGHAGILVDTISADELALAILKVLKDDSLRHHLRTKGLKRAQEFAWRKSARQTLDIIERVARTRRPNQGN